MNICLFDSQPEAAKLWHQLASSQEFNLSVIEGWTSASQIPADTRLLVLDQSAFKGSFCNDVISLCRSMQAMTLVVTTGRDLEVRAVVELMRTGVFHVLEKPYTLEQLMALVEEIKIVVEDLEASNKEYEHLSNLFQTLTHREKHVLDCVLAGDSNKEAAKKLKVSVRTVESRRAKVYRKLELKHVAELVRKIDRLEQLNLFFSLELETKRRMIPRPYLFSAPRKSEDADQQAC